MASTPAIGARAEGGENPWIEFGRGEAIGGGDVTEAHERVHERELKLRAKGLVEKLPHSRRYRLLPNGYSICLVFLKLFERVYERVEVIDDALIKAAPLTAGLLSPGRADAKLPNQRRSQLDLIHAVGLKAA